MVYRVRQRIFSLGGAFAITDENGNQYYRAQGAVFSLGRRLTLFDMNNNEICMIQQELFRFMPTYNVLVNGREVANIRKQFRFFRQDFEVNSSMGNFSIEGEPFGYDFRIAQNGRVVATISKAFFAWTDSYAVEVASGQNDAFILALAIIIDMVCHEEN